MRALLQLLLTLGVIMITLIAVGLGIGALLHWLIPSIELGVATLIGVIALGFSVMLFSMATGRMWEDSLDTTGVEEQVTYLISPYPEPRRRRRRKTTPPGDPTS
jgi:hypothetical protein